MLAPFKQVFDFNNLENDFIPDLIHLILAYYITVIYRLDQLVANGRAVSEHIHFVLLNHLTIQVHFILTYIPDKIHFCAWNMQYTYLPLESIHISMFGYFVIIIFVIVDKQNL